MRVEFTKWDGRLHWHFDLDPLGEDEHGLWLAGRPGCRLQRGAEPPQLEVHGFACLVPHQGRWIAYFNASQDPEIYIDVTDEPIRGDGFVGAIDLDLDVLRWRDGRVTIDDEDEFAEHQVRFGYPAEVITATEMTAHTLVDRVTSRTEPFDRAAERWLALVTG